MTRCRSRIRLWLQVLALVSCLAVPAPPQALADGAPLPPFGYEADVLMPGQTAILLSDGAAGREDLILSVRLEGGPEAAWVVPVPGLPTVRTAQVDWFAQRTCLPLSW